MTFRRSADTMPSKDTRLSKAGRAHEALKLAAGVVLAAAFLSPSAGYAERLTAVIPTQTIYPGEAIDASRVEVVDVTNPDLADGYVKSLGEIEGKVTKRTLLPGRVILASALREQYAVERGSTVRLVFSSGGLTISAVGSPLQDAAVGELIRARNVDSGVIVSGTVMADGTIHVVAK